MFEYTTIRFKSVLTCVSRKGFFEYLQKPRNLTFKPPPPSHHTHQRSQPTGGDFLYVVQESIPPFNIPIYTIFSSLYAWFTELVFFLLLTVKREHWELFYYYVATYSTYA